MTLRIGGRQCCLGGSTLTVSLTVRYQGFFWRLPFKQFLFLFGIYQGGMGHWGLLNLYSGFYLSLLQSRRREVYNRRGDFVRRCSDGFLVAIISLSLETTEREGTCCGERLVFWLWTPGSREEEGSAGSSGVLVLSTTSICFPHLSCPLLRTHLYISTIVSTHSHILLHETLDVTKESPSYSESIQNYTTHTFCLIFFGW